MAAPPEACRCCLGRHRIVAMTPRPKSSQQLVLSCARAVKVLQRHDSVGCSEFLLLAPQRALRLQLKEAFILVTPLAKSSQLRRKVSQPAFAMDSDGCSCCQTNKTCLLRSPIRQPTRLGWLSPFPLPRLGAVASQPTAVPPEKHKRARERSGWISTATPHCEPSMWKNTYLSGAMPGWLCVCPAAFMQLLLLTCCRL